MLAALSDVVRNIVVLIILVTIMDLLLPRSHFRPFVNMVVGLVLMLMLLAPLRSVLHFPGALDPVLEMRLAVSESDIEQHYAMLEQLNWDLTLDRYRSLVRERIETILSKEGVKVSELELELEEDVNHLEFGQPHRVVVRAGPAAAEAAGPGQVERVKIEIGKPAPDTAEAFSRDGRLERLVAEALGMRVEQVEVYLQTAE